LVKPPSRSKSSAVTENSSEPIPLTAATLRDVAMAYDINKLELVSSKSHVDHLPVTAALRF
jgi:hypothetical protein